MTEVRDDQLPRDAGKGAAIVSDLDLTSGLLGTQTLGIVGYDPAYAHAFVRNVILWTLNGRGPVQAWDDPPAPATATATAPSQ